jgi:hypothetical protein
MTGGGSLLAGLDELIEEKLKLMEAQRYGMLPPDSQVEAAFASIAQRTKMTPETFSKAIGTFGTINYLGSPVAFRTLSSELYSNSKSQNTQTAFAMAILMICIAAISVFINQKLIGTRKSYATVGGKGGRSTLIGLTGWKVPITIILFFFFIFVSIQNIIY